MDFKYLKELIGKLGNTIPSGKCLTIEENENYFSYKINKLLPKDEYGFELLMVCKIFYTLYIHPYGIENVIKEISNITDSTEREWATYLIEQADDIKIIADKDFESDLYVISENLNVSYEQLNSLFVPYRPFLLLKDYIEFGISNLLEDNYKYFYILLLIYIKNQYLLEDEYLRIQKEIVDIFVKYKEDKQYLQIDKLFKTFGQINQSKLLDHDLSLSLNKILYNDKFPPLNGDIFISWINVIFWDGYYFIYHPAFPDGDKGRLPLRIEDPCSRRDFNNLQTHFVKKLCPIYVKAVDGRIIKVHNHQNLSECISIIEKKIHSISSNESNDEQSHKKYLSKNEVKDIIKQHKSNCYLEYLCNEHLDDYKVVYCIENRVNSNDNLTIEHSFIFTIKGSDGNLRLVFENIEISRCSYVYNTSEKTWSEDINSISDFFVSDMVNKRLRISQQKIDCSLFKDNNCIRVMHSDYYKWKECLKG